MPETSTRQPPVANEAFDVGYLPGTRNNWPDPVPESVGEALDRIADSDVSNLIKGPGSSTDNAIMRWDGTNGKKAQDSLWKIDDSGNLVIDGTTSIQTEAAQSLSILPAAVLFLGTASTDSVEIGRAGLLTTIHSPQTWGGDVDLNTASFDFTRGAETVLRLLDVASAVDFLTISNAALPNGASGPILTPDGTSTNTNLRAGGKGTGLFELISEMTGGLHTIGFTQQTVTYDSGTTTVNWTTGNKAKLTFGAGNITTLAFTNPTNPCNVLLVIVQDGTGGRVVTNWDADILFVNGTIPTLSTGANAIDVLSAYWDGTNYLAAVLRRFA